MREGSPVNDMLHHLLSIDLPYLDLLDLDLLSLNGVADECWFPAIGEGGGVADCRLRPAGRRLPDHDPCSGVCRRGPWWGRDGIAGLGRSVGAGGVGRRASRVSQGEPSCFLPDFEGHRRGKAAQSRTKVGEPPSLGLTQSARTQMGFLSAPLGAC